MIDRQVSRDDLREFEKLTTAKHENRLLLRSRPNVIAMDIGYRTKDGKRTPEKVVKVYVSQKLPREMLRDEDVLPDHIGLDNESFPIDVEVGRIDQPQVFNLRVRPLVGGASISSSREFAAGTLGVNVTLNDNRTYILTNNHVIAGANRNRIGTGVVQPGRLDGGGATTDTVARLSDFVPLDFGSTTISIFGTVITIPNPNNVDAALAEVTNSAPSTGEDAFNGADRAIHWVGYPRLRGDGTPGLFPLLSLLGRRVAKMGRTTHYTLGRIVSVFYDTWVGPYANGSNAWFEDQIRIEGLNGRFSAPGDSGSLVVDAETNEPIGLLFSGSGNFTNANRIDLVMQSLNIPQL